MSMSVLEGVTLLVQTGYSDRFVLEEISIDTFKDLVLVCQKMKLMHYQQEGLAFTVALASVLSTDGAEKAREGVMEQLEKLDTAFLGGDNDEDEDEWVDAPVTGRRRKKKPPKQKQMERMARMFHSGFAKATGQAIPSFDNALKTAQVNKRAALATPQE